MACSIRGLQDADGRGWTEGRTLAAFRAACGKREGASRCSVWHVPGKEFYLVAKTFAHNLVIDAVIIGALITGCG